jgi:hypothetical protein
VSVDSGGGVLPTSSQYTDGGNAGLTLQPGVWMVFARTVFTVGSTATLTKYIIGVGTASGNNGSGLTLVDGAITREFASHTPSTSFTEISGARYVNITAATTYYPKFYIIAGTLTGSTAANYIDAVRIA